MERERLSAVAQYVSDKTRTLLARILALAILSLLSGLGIWAAAFHFPSVDASPTAAGVMLLLLAAPAAVLLLFYTSLRELVYLPQRLQKMLGEGSRRISERHAASRKETGTRRQGWRFFRSLLELRTLLMESKGLLLRYTLLVRLLHPLSLLLLLVSTIASLLLIGIALIVLLRALLF